MACHWKPLCHLSLKSKSADLSPGLWQKSYFFCPDTHTRMHTHQCSGLMDTWLSQLVYVRCLAVRWTLGCPYWWMFTVLLMDTWLSQLVDCWIWLCNDISAKLSSANGHWWWYGFGDDGSAISLDMNLFTSRCWSHCLPSDADVLPSDCNFFHFFTVLCSSDYLLVCCLMVYLSEFVVFYIDYAVLSFNHVHVLLHDCVLPCILLFVLQIDIIFILRFYFATVLCDLSHWTLPVTVLRYFISVSLLLLTVVFFYAVGQRVRVPLPVCLFACITCSIL